MSPCVEGRKQAPVTLIKQSVGREGRARGEETTSEQSPCGLYFRLNAATAKTRLALLVVTGHSFYKTHFNIPLSLSATNLQQCSFEFSLYT